MVGKIHKEEQPMKKAIFIVLIISFMISACGSSTPEPEAPAPTSKVDEPQAAEDTGSMEEEVMEETQVEEMVEEWLENIEGEWVKPAAYVDEHLILDADGTWLVVTPYTGYPVTEKDIEAARIFGQYTFEDGKLALSVDEEAEVCAGTVGVYKVTVIEEGKINLDTNTEQCKLRQEIIAGDWTLQVGDE
jgi:hypothetical protein